MFTFNYGEPQVYGVTGELNNVKTVNCSTAITDPSLYRDVAPYLRVNTPIVQSKPRVNWGIADINAVVGYQDQIQPSPYGRQGGSEGGMIEGFEESVGTIPQPYASGLPNLMADGSGYSSAQAPQTTYQGLSPIVGAPLDQIGGSLTPGSYAEPWPVPEGAVDVPSMFGGRGAINIVEGFRSLTTGEWIVMIFLMLLVFMLIVGIFGSQ